MVAKFFITHSWKDVDFARCLADDLRAHGLDGFFDIYSVQPGDDIVARINRGLEECDVYIPILSAAALKSPWCDEEINAAIMLSKQRGREGRPRIIPILIEDCATALPPLLQHRLYVNFTAGYDPALRELLEKGFGICLEVERRDREKRAEPTPVKSQIDSPRADRIKLRKCILSAYDWESFRILAKDMGRDIHDLPGEIFETKVMSLIDYCQRHRLYEELVSGVLQDHPYLVEELR